MSIPAETLIDWYRQQHRDLPWRAPGVTPWQILVSEFMLQQTPVARVAPIWVDWVARWPTASATAAAGAADVLRAWGKLGYPRRAKRLHECASVIATEYGDVVPDDVAGGAHHEHVAKALIENDLRRDSAVGASEDDGLRALLGCQARAVFDTLAWMLGAACDEPLVTLL